VFNSWWRFAKWSLLIPSAQIIFPYQGRDMFFGGQGEQALFFAVLFFLISLGIIITKSRKLRGK
jgi:hypothetical protein